MNIKIPDRMRELAQQIQVLELKRRTYRVGNDYPSIHELIALRKEFKVLQRNHFKKWSKQFALDKL